MENMRNVAGYIATRYKDEYKADIDEMKLHKLMYFAQREAYVIFERYAGKSSWSLSRLTHGELSWRNSRIGIKDEVNSDNPISNEDIIKDAARIKARLAAFS